MSAKINNPPAKILLNQSTKMSLNDRFSSLSKVRRLPASAPAKQQVVKMNNLRGGGSSNNNHTNSARSNLLQKTATPKNRRLALQMANRPSVQAALRIKKKSVNQRLGIGQARAQALVKKARTNTAAGGGIAARLSGLKRGVGKGLLRQRVGRGGGIRRRLGGAPGGGIQSRLSGGSLIVRRGGNGLRRGGLRGGRGGNFKARLNNIVNKNAANTSNNGGGSLNSSLTTRRNAISAAGNAGGTTRFYNRNNNRGRFNRGRGGNNNRRGGRGGGRPNQPQQPRSKDALDTDLDQYMAKSKASLDADLNSYMAQGN